MTARRSRGMGVNGNVRAKGPSANSCQCSNQLRYKYLRRSEPKRPPLADPAESVSDKPLLDSRIISPLQSPINGVDAHQQKGR